MVNIDEEMLRLEDMDVSEEKPNRFRNINLNDVSYIVKEGNSIHLCGRIQNQVEFESQG